MNVSESSTYRDNGGEGAGAGLEGVDQTKHGVWRMRDEVGVGGKEEVKKKRRKDAILRYRSANELGVRAIAGGEWENDVTFNIQRCVGNAYEECRVA